jgi:hypothetical protein
MPCIQKRVDVNSQQVTLILFVDMGADSYTGGIIGDCRRRLIEQLPWLNTCHPLLGQVNPRTNEQIRLGIRKLGDGEPGVFRA